MSKYTQKEHAYLCRHIKSGLAHQWSQNEFYINRTMNSAKTVADLYITRTKKHFKMNKEIGMMLPKKELIQVE